MTAGHPRAELLQAIAAGAGREHCAVGPADRAVNLTPRQAAA